MSAGGNTLRILRLRREIEMFEKEQTGFLCYPKVEDVYDELVAHMEGPEKSPYENKTFKLKISLPGNYPHEPPLVKFTTPVYHPNIDKEGRICLDLLKNSEWKSTNKLLDVLNSIKVLLSNPNCDDPLMQDIANEYRFNNTQYLENAKKNSGDSSLA
ncbi:ubiquitin-conjugating enzyme E2 T-like [Epargyreus clarus]|uniref:ubiquitin-conjugating enzyme E2 T-like n=1 Tax=Epargyreus clarus TaxID=520877 RepID=UPI003C2D1F1C